MALKKITYNGSSKVIKRLCEVVNDLIDSGATDTWRNVKVNGTELLGTGTDTGALNLKSGTNVTVSGSGNDVIISATDTTYSDATQSASGLMSASDKTKLDGIASGAEVNVQSDWTEADNTSDAYIANKPNLAAVATSGAYSDLSGTPSLATVATSGLYSDLSGTPTIPTVNDATLTLTQGGSTLGTFTANASSNVTIDVPSAGSPSASSVSYDNTGSGMTASNVQDAIDEVVADIPDMTNVAYKNTDNNFTKNQTIDRQNGTISTDGISYLVIGNNIPRGTEKNSFGVVEMYGLQEYYTNILAPDSTANRTINFPDKSGIVALTSDIPTDFVSKASGGTFKGNIGVDRQDGTTSATGSSYLQLGNNQADRTEGNSRGVVYIYSNTAYRCALRSATGATANRSVYLPDAGGTLALNTVSTSESFTSNTTNVSNVVANIAKMERLVNFSFSGKILSSSTGTNVQLGTLSNGAKPLFKQQFIVTIQGITTTISVDPDGKVYMYPDQSLQNWTIYFAITYISAS